MKLLYSNLLFLVLLFAACGDDTVTDTPSSNNTEQSENEVKVEKEKLPTAKATIIENSYVCPNYSFELTVMPNWKENTHFSHQQFSSVFTIYPKTATGFDKTQALEIHLPLFILENQIWEDYVNRNFENPPANFEWGGGGDPFSFLKTKTHTFIAKNRWQFYFDDVTKIDEVEAVFKSMKEYQQ